MAIFAGAATQSIDAVAYRIYSDINPAYINRLPYPSKAFQPALYGAVVTGTATPSIVPVVVLEQHNDRQNRFANLGPAPADGQGVGFDWFEKIHVKPQRLDLGNVVSDLTELLELYNAYRIDPRQWTTFANNAGDGITISNLPTLPKEIPPSSSFEISILISPDGPPNINGTLDFTFDVTSVSVPITGTRIILFGAPPTGVATEKLSWLTDVMKSADGTEQRLAVRRFPRQEISFEALTQRDLDRNELNAFLFDWHSGIFGVPLWWDARQVAQDVAINDTVITVVNTDNADFRVGGLAAIIAFDADGNRTADTLEITAVNSSPASVEFSSGVSSAYTAGAAVLVPVVPGVLSSTIKKARVPSTAQTTKVSFLALDNDGSRIVPDASGFNTFNGKAVIDDSNCIDNVLNESFRKTVTRVDGDTGEILQSSLEDRSTPTSNKRWTVETSETLWQVKSLLYAIRGKQVSFYMPTFNQDFTMTASMGVGGTSLDVQNIGYTKFVKVREPFTFVAIHFNDDFVPTVPSPLPTGSPPEWVPGQQFLYFEIASSSEISATEERLFFTSGSPIPFDPADVKRVEFIVKSRFDSDTVELLHSWTDLMGGAVDSQVNVAVAGAYAE